MEALAHLLMVNNIVRSSKLVLSWTLTLHRYNRIHKYFFYACQAMSKMGSRKFVGVWLGATDAILRE